MLKRFTSSFWGKVASVLGTKCLILILSLTTSIIVARMLGPEGRGLVSAALVIGGMGAQFMNLGLHSSSKYLLTRYPDRLDGVWGNVTALSLAAALPALMIYVTLTLFPSLMDISGIMLALACASIPLLLYTMLQLNVLVGVDQVMSFNRAELITACAHPVLLMLFFTVFSPRAEAAYSANMLAGCISASLAAFWLAKKFQVRPRPDLKLFKSGFSFGLKAYTASLMSYLAAKCNIVIVNGMLGNTMTGYYTLASSMTDIISLAAASLGLILFNDVLSMKTDGERRDFMKRAAKTFSLLLALAVLAAGWVAKYAIVMMYGDEFLPSLTVFRLLLPAAFFMSLTGVFSNYFAARNMWTGNIIAPCLGFISSVALNAALIPGYGLAGAALASGAASFVMFSIMIGRFVYDNHRKDAG